MGNANEISVENKVVVMTFKTLFSIVATAVIAYAWLFSTFVNAADFRVHTQTYELDRTADKIDGLEVLIFNLTEDIRDDGGDTRERREQLSKYEGALLDYRTQQRCLESGGTNCRRAR